MILRYHTVASRQGYRALAPRCDIVPRRLVAPRDEGSKPLIPEDFSTDAPGRLVRSPTGYWTFEPSPLPPSLTFTAPLVRQIAEAERALGELGGLGRMLPNPHLLIRSFVRREAVLSSRIEGTVTRLDELLRFEAQAEEDSARAEDVAEVINYVEAMGYGLKRLSEGMPLCLRLIREIHQRLLEGVRGGDKRPGAFRHCPVLIGRKGQTFADARFVPPAHTALEPVLRDFERFLNTPGEIPVVVQLALMHYQFEAIHPFMDGNGRVGRLLVTLMLCERGGLSQPLLYLSAYLERHDQAYKDHLLAVSQRGAWEDWIAFFARGVAEQAADAVRRAWQLLDLRQRYRERMQQASQSSGVLRLVDELFAAPFVTMPGVARLLEVTHRAAKLNVEKLIDASILKEVEPPRKTKRVYFAPEILAMLNADFAPGATAPPPGP
jgi:Fic family protein